MPLCIHPQQLPWILDLTFITPMCFFLFVLYGDAVPDHYIYVHIHNFVCFQLYMKCLVLHTLLCDFLGIIFLGLIRVEMCRLFHSFSLLYSILFCEYSITDYVLFAWDIQDISSLSLFQRLCTSLYTLVRVSLAHSSST